MFDLQTARSLSDLRHHEMELRAQRFQLVMDARVASDPASPAFPRRDRSRMRLTLSRSQ